MALITGTGGGTLRSMLIGDTPPPILQDPTYIIVAAIAVPVAIVSSKVWQKFSRQVSVVDALGLGIFTCIGARVAMDHGLEWWAAIGMGTVTATFGGVIRDVLRNDLPLIFRKEIYATAALLGAGMMLLLDLAGMDAQLSMVLAAVSTAAIRILSIRLAINASEA